MAPIDRWIEAHEREHGPFAPYVGFEADIVRWSDGLAAAWRSLDDYAQAEFFAFVASLMIECREDLETLGELHATKLFWSKLKAGAC